MRISFEVWPVREYHTSHYKLIDTIALSECYLINFSLVSMRMFFYCTHIAKFSLGVFTYEIVVWNSAARKVKTAAFQIIHCFGDERTQ